MSSLFWDQYLSCLWIRRYSVHRIYIMEILSIPECEERLLWLLGLQKYLYRYQGIILKRWTYNVNFNYWWFLRNLDITQSWKIWTETFVNWWTKWQAVIGKKQWGIYWKVWLLIPGIVASTYIIKLILKKFLCRSDTMNISSLRLLLSKINYTQGECNAMTSLGFYFMIQTGSVVPTKISWTSYCEEVSNTQQTPA